MLDSFQPIYRITPAIAKALMAIEADRQAIIDLPMTTQMLQSLRESARLLSTHYSTQIEGNRLTEAQVKEVIEGGGRFPGRERDEAEVRNYFRALEFIEGQAREQVGVSETLIQRIHGLTYHGRPTPTAYRDGLKGIYALEAYYARRLEDYYEALDVGEGHNYYVGNRAQADVTGFIEYFVRGMADSFAKVREQASKQKSLGQRDQSSVLRNLSPTQRQMLELFRDQAAINAKDLATLFKVSQRQASRYCQQWVEQGFLVVADPAKRSRRYRLSSEYESLFL